MSGDLISAVGDRRGHGVTLGVRIGQKLTLTCELDRDQAEQLAIELQQWLLDTCILEFGST